MPLPSSRHFEDAVEDPPGDELDADFLGTRIMVHFESDDEPGKTEWYEGEVVEYIGDRGDVSADEELLRFNVYFDADDETLPLPLSIEDYDAQRNAPVGSLGM